MNHKNKEHSLPASNPVTADQVINFDPSEFAHHLAEMNLTPEQQDELIRVTANIMRAFVDMGFGISPVQTALPPDNCAEPEFPFENLTLTEEDLLYLSTPDNAYAEHIAATKYAITGEKQ